MPFDHILCPLWPCTVETGVDKALFLYQFNGTAYCAVLYSVLPPSLFLSRSDFMLRDHICCQLLTRRPAMQSARLLV